MAAGYTSLADLFEQSCRGHANNTAYLSMGVAMSYAQTLQKAQAFAAWPVESWPLRPSTPSLQSFSKIRDESLSPAIRI
ncbi:hypothetical protein CDEF62S_01445 [Castellaniella defragrans]